jgi:hypothetical protein
VGYVLMLPFIFVIGAAIAAVVCVRLSSLRITSDGVEIRNYPQAAKLVPLAQVGAFEATTATGNFKSIRPATAVLVLTDGSRIPVRTISEPDAGIGVPALNKRVESLRNKKS